MAGLAVAGRYGLEMEGALDLAEKLYVDVNIFSKENEEILKRLPKLPASCWESGECLLRDRKHYEKDSVFSPVVIDEIAGALKGYDDKDLSERLYGKENERKELVEQYLHYS